MAKAPLEIRSLARKHTHKALNTLVSIMVEPKAPAAARIMAANSLLDRGWGRAPQHVELQGDVKHLLEVKLTVVEPQPDCNLVATDDTKLLELKADTDVGRTVRPEPQRGTDWRGAPDCGPVEPEPK